MTAFGLTMGFGTLIPPDLLAAVKQFGWTHIRNGNQPKQPLSSPSELAALAAQIQQAGMTPVMGILHVSQLPTFPLTDQIIEASTTGEEPTADVLTEAAAFNAPAVVSAVKAKRLRVYVGMKGTTQSDIAWTAAFCKLLDPVYGICVHRYPPARATTWDAPQWNSRAFELQQLKSAIGPRPFMVGECGWNQGPFKRHWWEYLFFTHSHLTDDEQTAAIQGEFGAWPGADVVCLYQFSDGPHYCGTHPQYANTALDGYGIRRVDSKGNHLSWKPSARIPSL